MAHDPCAWNPRRSTPHTCPPGAICSLPNIPGGTFPRGGGRDGGEAVTDLLMTRTARISDCGRYRYLLTRTWGEAPPLPFVMLNPSVADAEVDDPTIRRCIWFARREGAGGIVVTNLYAWRATRPADLWKAEDPCGPDNDAVLVSVATQARADGVPLVCAWGAHGGNSNRLIVLMQQVGGTMACLGRTKQGKPRHPLYVRGDQPLEVFP